MKITISGKATAMNDEGQPITNPDRLRTLDGIVYDEEQFTEFLYLGGTEKEHALLSLLKPGGYVEIHYVPEVNELQVVTEYEASRSLTPEELQTLVDFTTDQWSDGIGENFTCLSRDRYGCEIEFCPLLEDDDAYKPLVEQKP